MDLNTENLKARWAELTPLFEEKDAARNERWAVINSIADGSFKGSLAEAQAMDAQLREEIKTLHAEIVPIEQERAIVARALGGFCT